MQLNVTTRTNLKKQVSALRQKGIIPGVVYGHKKTNQVIQVSLRDLEKAYAEAGESTLIDLTVDAAKPMQVVIHAIDRNNVTDHIEHVDFYAVTMTEKITTEVTLNFIGESLAVKGLGGILVKNMSHLNVRCLPGSLIKQFDINISSLKTFEDSIKVKDLQLPEGIEIIDLPKQIIAVVTPPRSDEEIAALNQSVKEDVTKVEGITKPNDGAAASTSDKPKK